MHLNPLNHEPEKKACHQRPTPHTHARLETLRLWRGLPPAQQDQLVRFQGTPHTRARQDSLLASDRNWRVP